MDTDTDADNDNDNDNNNQEPIIRNVQLYTKPMSQHFYRQVQF